MADLKAKIEIRAEDRFSDVAAKVGAAGGKLARRVEGVGRELAALDARGSAVKRLGSLESRLGRTGQAMDAARRRTAALGREIAQTADPVARKLQREFDSARRTSDRLKRSHRAQRDEVRGLREELRSAGIDTRRLGDAQRGIAGDIDRATRRMERMGEAADRVAAAQKRVDRSMERASRGALVAGGLREAGHGALGLVASPLGAAREVAAARGELASLQMDRAGIDLVVQRGRELSRQVAGITAAGFTAASYDIKSGIESLDAAGVADMAEMAAITARATRADPGQMTGLFATGYGMFKETLYAGLGDREFGAAFADQLSAAVGRFKTDGSRMQQAIQSAGAGLANAGISMESQFAALGRLQQKMEPGEAGTALKALAGSAADADAKLREAGYGMRTLDERGNVLPLAELLAGAEREFGGMGASERLAALKKAFGSEEAVRFFDALWGQAGTLRDDEAALATAAQSGGSSARAMASRRDDNIDARMELMQQRWDDIQLRIGEALVPTLERAIPWIERIADGVGGWIERFPGVTAFLAGGAGALGLLAVAAAPVVTAVTSVALALDHLRRRAVTTSATLATRDIAAPGGKGGAGPGGWLGRTSQRLRGAGKGGWKGLAEKIRGSGRQAAPKALGFLKGKGGILGGILGAAAIGGTLLDSELSGREKAAGVTRDAGGIAGGLAGAAAGAALGSVVPFVGTAIGAIVGGIAGGLLGDAAGAVAGRAIHDPGAAAAAIGSAGTEGEAVRKSARELRGLERRQAPAPTAPAGAAAAGLVEALEIGPSAPTAPSGTGSRSVSIVNHITLEARPSESDEDLIARLLRALEIRQALAGREALGDAY